MVYQIFAVLASSFFFFSCSNNIQDYEEAKKEFSVEFIQNDSVLLAVLSSDTIEIIREKWCEKIDSSFYSIDYSNNMYIKAFENKIIKLDIKNREVIAIYNFISGCWAHSIDSKAEINFTELETIKYTSNLEVLFFDDEFKVIYSSTDTLERLLEEKYLGLYLYSLFAENVERQKYLVKYHFYDINAPSEETIYTDTVLIR